MIDVVIPCCKDDLQLLPLTVQGARQNVVGGVNKVIVVTPEPELVKIDGVEAVHDNDVASFPIDLLRPKLGSRAGWLYQQIIKLSADSVATTEDFLILDADHILLQPHEFKKDGKTVFYTTSEHHLPYFKAIDRLFDGQIKKEVQPSFISDKMLLNKDMLGGMKEEIEDSCMGDWDWSIVKNYSYDSQSGFSEFETYGNWFATLRNDYELRDANRNMSHRIISHLTLEQLQHLFPTYSSITQHKLAV